MHFKEAKDKLEFSKVINRVKHHTYSDLGAGLCDEIEFFVNPELLEAELDKVSEMMNILNHSGDLPLEGLKDIRQSLSKIKIEGYFISPLEFLDILEFLRISRKLRKLVADIPHDEVKNLHYIPEMTKRLFSDRILEHNIEITIDENGDVKDSASAALHKIRKQINAQSERLRKTLSNILKKVSELDYTRDEIMTQRDGRFVIPVKTENKRDVPGIIHSSSATGATVFIEPTESINLNNELTELYFEEKREIEKILRELASQLSLHTEEIKVNIDILAETDFLNAKARYAIETISVKPVLNSRYTKFVNAYHPVLLQTHKRSEVVPLNITIGDEFNTLIISGPNAGGKTVVLKTVGLIQLMLQSGMPVPVSPESEFTIYENIFVNIGDEQSLENDLSTFSSHLRSIGDIIEHANDRSLVLIDEIASGTDPVLGSALSSAILKLLSKKNAVTIVTTHNSQLKEFAFNQEKIDNASLEFDSETLSPNFKFVQGIPGQSFTFEIAKRYNFPQNVIDEARTYLDKKEVRLEELLKDLNETKQKYNTLKNKFDVENVRLTGLTNLYDKKIAELNKNERELKYKAKLEAEKILKDANKLVEKTIKEIREDKLSPKEIKSEFAKESEKITDITEVAETVQPADGEIAVNDSVRIRNTNSIGNVISISSGTATLNMNGLMIKTKINEIEKVVQNNFTQDFSDIPSVKISDSPAFGSIDIRGKYSMEIENDLEKFLQESVLNGFKEVSIIHGKGSGRLREEVQKYLKRNTSVKTSRPGNWNEGGSGVTIVELI